MKFYQTLFRICAVSTTLASAMAQDAAAPAASSVLTLDMVHVIGSAENERTLPGSGTYISDEQIQRHSTTNINRILRRTTGVSLREEDGYGNFPNISLRGLDGGRSSKITILEDGVPTSPAPYSAPAAYYFPAVGRMSGVEVLKASSQIKYGPNTSGGVLNFLSTPIPDEFVFRLKAQYGSDNEWLGHAYAGSTETTAIGRVGWLLEGYFHTTDGFRRVDERPGYNSGDETGFRRIEPMFKLSWEPDADMPQRVELKIGYTDFEADESYLGLAEKDFGANPYRRYAATRYDHIDYEHFRSSLRYQIEVNEHLTLATTAYYHGFHRDWFKLTDMTTEDGEKLSLSSALARGGDSLAVLKGNRAGQFNYRSNNRDYDLAGVQTQALINFETGEVSHQAELGLRLHWDQAVRFQRDTAFTQDASGRVIRSKKGPAGGGGNREEESYALALFAQDRMQLGRLAVIPGVRYEYVEQEYRDFNTTGSPSKLVESGSGSTHLFAPGLGLNYEASDRITLFGGVYRGFTIPEPRAAIRDGADPETSIGYELGARYATPAFSASATLFYTRFDDLIVIDNIGAGGSGSSENVGKVDARGVELQLGYDPGVAHEWIVKVPMRAGLTLNHARLNGDASSGDAGSIFSGGKDGNRVPYVPDYEIFAGIGIEYAQWSLNLDATYTPGTYATASNTTSQRNPKGEPDARFGRTDAAFLMDATASWQVSDQWRIFGGVRNVVDTVYLSSRHPEGPRAGAPRTFFVGAEVKF